MASVSKTELKVSLPALNVRDRRQQPRPRLNPQYESECKYRNVELSTSQSAQLTGSKTSPSSLSLTPPMSLLVSPPCSMPTLLRTRSQPSAPTHRGNGRRCRLILLKLGAGLGCNLSRHLL